MPAGLSLGLSLKRVVGGPANVAKFQNGVAVWGVERRHVRSAARGTAESIASGAASRGAAGVEVIARQQDVVAARTGIAHRQNHIAGQLPLDVGVVLLDL